MDEMMSAVLALADKHLGEFKIRNGQVVAKTCPFCHGGKSGDTETFAIGMHNGAFSCLRGGCGKTGSFRELCDFFGEHSVNAAQAPKAIGKTKKVYAKPDPEKMRE